MNLKISPFSIQNKERRKIYYIKGFYKKPVQTEIESSKDTEYEDKKDKTQVEDLLMLDKISIKKYFLIQTPKFLLIIK